MKAKKKALLAAVNTIYIAFTHLLGKNLLGSK